MQETGQESNVCEKLHILPLERKSVFRDLKMYLVKETRSEYILNLMAKETESCQPDMPITTESRLILPKQRLTTSERK